MLIILMMTLVSFALSLVMFFLALFLSEKSKKEREKLTPFECGFSPFKKARSPFSLRFFMVTLIFLIFDIELALLLPLGIMNIAGNKLIITFLGVIVTFILAVGLFHEWSQGALNWVE